MVPKPMDMSEYDTWGPKLLKFFEHYETLLSMAKKQNLPPRPKKRAHSEEADSEGSPEKHSIKSETSEKKVGLVLHPSPPAPVAVCVGSSCMPPNPTKPTQLCLYV